MIVTPLSTIPGASARASRLRQSRSPQHIYRSRSTRPLVPRGHSSHSTRVVTPAGHLRATARPAHCAARRTHGGLQFLVTARHLRRVHPSLRSPRGFKETRSQRLDSEASRPLTTLTLAWDFPDHLVWSLRRCGTAVGGCCEPISISLSICFPRWIPSHKHRLRKLLSPEELVAT